MSQPNVGCQVYWQIQKRGDQPQVVAEGRLVSTGTNSGEILGDAAVRLYCAWNEEDYLVNFVGLVWDDEVESHPDLFKDIKLV